jgi:hypothetical protein
VSYPVHIRLFSGLLRNTPALVDLEISCHNATPAFFKQPATAVPVLKLRRLSLNNITTPYKYVPLFFEACHKTLCHVELRSISFARPNDGHAMLHFLKNSMALDTSILTKLNVDGRGMKFDKVNRQQPYLLYTSENCELSGEP